MVKSKQQQLVPATAKRKKSSGATEVDLLGEDGWVVVKKQKVIIIIPPSPVRKQETAANTTEPPRQAKPTRRNKRQPKFKAETHPLMHSAGGRENSKSPTPERTGLNTTVTPPQPIPTILNLAVPDHKPKSPDQSVDNTRGHKMISGCGSSKMVLQLAVSADRSSLLNQRMRALILEKKLKRAGGLSNWLVSLGLGRFIKIFQCKNVNKFQLACLTMEKLKDMGAFAVGPRRKLLHAIDCLCRPYCFQH